MCFDEIDCAARKHSHLGSSSYWPHTLQGEKAGGITLLSDDPNANPDFHDFNRLYVPYCSGDVFMGRQATPTNPFNASGSSTFYFQGFDLLATLTAQLLSNATTVLLTGCSAGGIGTIFVADYMTKTLPNALIKAAPAAGWFGFGPFDRWEWFKHGKADPDPYHIGSVHGWLGGIKTYLAPAVEACYADQHQDSHLCGFAPFVYKYVKTPCFIAQNLADSFQVQHEGGMPGYLPTTPTERAYVVHFATQLRASLITTVLHGPKNLTDGLYAPGCYAHFLNTSHLTRGASWFQALGSWFFGRPGQKQILDMDLSLEHMLSCASAPPV